MEVIVKNLKKQSIQLGNVLDNTLNWVLMELGERIEKKETIHIQSLTREIVQTMEVGASSKNINISYREEGDPLVTEIEANPVKIILKNLIDNALKFTNPDQEIKVGFYSFEKKLLWEVGNPGEPLKEKALEDLFTSLIDPTLGTNSEKGTGIGLSLSKEIADSIGMKLQYSYENGFHFFRLEKRF
jgi:two-component system, sensor histidine kinase and response regulator